MEKQTFQQIVQIVFRRHSRWLRELSPYLLTHTAGWGLGGPSVHLVGRGGLSSVHHQVQPGLHGSTNSVHQQCPAAVSSTRSSRRSPVIALSRQLLPSPPATLHPPPRHPPATCHRHPIVRTYSITCASTAIERLHSTTEYFVYIDIDRNVCVYFTILHCTKLH